MPNPHDLQESIMRYENKPRAPHAFLPHIVLWVEMGAGTLIWLFRDRIFGVGESTDMMAMITAMAMTLSGVVGFIVLKKNLARDNAK